MFFFNYTATTEIYTLSLHDDLPISNHNLKANLLKEYIDVKIDNSDRRPGEKFFQWEMKGVPFRIEFGEKELESGEVTIFIRDIRKKVSVKLDNLSEEIKNLGAEYDARLLVKADEFFGDKIVNCKDKLEIKNTLNSGKRSEEHTSELK